MNKYIQIKNKRKFIHYKNKKENMKRTKKKKKKKDKTINLESRTTENGTRTRKNEMRGKTVTKINND